MRERCSTAEHLNRSERAALAPYGLGEPFHGDIVIQSCARSRSSIASVRMAFVGTTAALLVRKTEHCGPDCGVHVAGPARPVCVRVM